MASICYSTTETNNINRDELVTFSLFTSDEAVAILNSIEHIERLFYNDARIKTVQDAYKEFEEACEAFNHDEATTSILVERRFRAFIFEFRMFLDHWETYINHHPKKKEYLNLFKEITGEKFDKSVSYKIIYALRNYVTHVDNVATSSLAGVDNNVYEPLADRRVLLEAKDCFKGKYKDAVMAYPARMISLRQISKDVMPLLQDIHDAMMWYQYDEKIETACRLLTSAYTKVVMSGVPARKWYYIDNENSCIMGKAQNEKYYKPIGPGFSYKVIDWKSYNNVAIYMIKLQSKKSAMDECVKGEL